MKCDVVRLRMRVERRTLRERGLIVDGSRPVLRDHVWRWVLRDVSIVSPFSAFVSCSLLCVVVTVGRALLELCK